MPNLVCPVPRLWAVHLSAYMNSAEFPKINWLGFLQFIVNLLLSPAIAKTAAVTAATEVRDAVTPLVPKSDRAAHAARPFQAGTGIVVGEVEREPSRPWHH